MRRKGFSGFTSVRDDIAAAWDGADAGLKGSNGLLTIALVGAIVWRLIK